MTEWTCGEDCDEDCVLFRESLCETKSEDGKCDRPFKPKGRRDAEECGMYYPRREDVKFKRKHEAILP